MILLTGATARQVRQFLGRLPQAVRTCVPCTQRSEGRTLRTWESNWHRDMGDVAAAACLQGAERALVLLPNGQQQLTLETQFVDLAQAAGVRHIVKVSSMEALPDAASPIPKVHYASEQHIKASGLDWTMIRPNFYMQNLLGGAATIRSQGRFFLPMGQGKVAMTDTRDVAAFIAHVLSTLGHAGESYEVTGPEILSASPAAQLPSQVLGKPVEYVDIAPAEYRKVLARFASSEWHLEAVMALFAEIAAGQPVYVTDTFRRVMGREPVSFAQFVRDHLATFGKEGG
jgi:uncharacterized protein YbjT (DUF2867 family)